MGAIQVIYFHRYHVRVHTSASSLELLCLMTKAGSQPFQPQTGKLILKSEAFGIFPDPYTYAMQGLIKRNLSV